MANQRPIVSGQTAIGTNVNQSFSFNTSLVNASDADGSVASFTFWDATAGSGYLTYDGQRISGTSVTVSTAQLGRVGYNGGPNTGSNSIVVTATDNLGLSSLDFAMTITVGSTANPTGPNALISYVDATPGLATATEIVQVALAFRGSLWGGELCTGLLWAVAELAGARFFDLDNMRTADGQHVQDTNYDVPHKVGKNLGPDVTDGWDLVATTSNWQSIVQPGDFVRVYFQGNPDEYTFLNGEVKAHSFIVVERSSNGEIRVIDNVNFGSASGGNVIVTDHVFLPTAQFGSQVLNPAIAYVHRIKTGTANSAPVVTATSANASVASGATVLASSLFTATDANGNGTITQYEFWDSVGAGRLLLNGAVQGEYQGLTVSAANLGAVQYRGGASGQSETLWVRASDGQAWSSWAQFTATATGTTQTYTLQPGPSTGTDVWITSVYSYDDNFGVDNNLLRVGGWGDQYYSLIRFDLSGLPTQASSATLRLFNQADASSNSVGMFLDRIVSPWNESTGWYSPRPNATQIAQLDSAPQDGAWYDINVTELFNAWQSGAAPNYGVQLRPVSNNNQFNEFYSSDHTDSSLRPMLIVTS